MRDSPFNEGANSRGIFFFVKSSNVLKEDVFLIDFGLARWADNNIYCYDTDFSYLGDFFLYLIYSTFSEKEKHKRMAWYDELGLPDKQKLFIKKLMRLKKTYENIEQVELDFISAFGNRQKSTIFEKVV